MPVPHPMKDEGQDKFMGRCMTFMHGENGKKESKDKWTQEQMVAICMSQWKNKSREKKSSTEEQEQQDDIEFVNRFLIKHPEYKKYFEQDNVEE